MTTIMISILPDGMPVDMMDEDDDGAGTVVCTIRPRTCWSVSVTTLGT
jgi:hypothetical protein